MDVDDSFDEVARVAMTGAAALSRAAEVLVRNAQDTKMRQASETARVTEDLQRRAEAQAGAAERYYARAGDREWVRSAGAEDVVLAWQGSHQWARLDPDRFTEHAARISDSVRQEFGIDLRDPEQRQRLNLDNTRTLKGEPVGVANRARGGEMTGLAQPAQAMPRVGYDTAERRAAADAQLRVAGVSPQARAAKTLSDQLNGHDPAQQIRSGATQGTARATGGMAQAKTRTGRVPERDHGRGR